MINQVATPAQALVDARQQAQALPAFPGDLPTTLDAAYALQADTIGKWGTDIAGWKVGRITGEAKERLGRNRFIGPIFMETVAYATADTLTPFPAIRGGSAALEAEIVAIIGQDIPPLRSDWRTEDIKTVVSGLHIGIEVAGSAVPDVSALGPLASIAASGNNLALILGMSIEGWRDKDVDGIMCITTIDGHVAGSARAGNLPGGPFQAIAFALNQAAELCIGIPAGTLISTGAITGVHSVEIGQRCLADFGPLGALNCEVVVASPFHPTVR